MSHKIVTGEGQRLVQVSEEAFRAESEMPQFPKPNAKGNYPAAETMAVSMARGIIRRRQALGWSQAELAKQARVRIQTLNRLETAEHVPSVRTVDKIDDALSAAEKKAGIRSPEESS